MKHVEIEGRRLAHRELGSGDAVVLLHPGFIADAMAPLAARAELAGFRLITFHRRGYGHSDRAETPASIADQARDVVALLDHLGVERAHLVGHSLGGTIAMHVAVAAPDRVGTLTVLDPLVPWALSSESGAFIAETAAIAMPRFFAGDHAGAVDAWLTGAFGPGYRPLLDRALPAAWNTAVRDAPTAFTVELPAVQDWSITAGDLAGVSSPALSVVNCDQRWAGFGETHDALLATIPGCDGAVVDVASHLLQLADPRPVSAVVAAFLSSHRLG